MEVEAILNVLTLILEYHQVEDSLVNGFADFMFPFCCYSAMRAQCTLCLFNFRVSQKIDFQLILSSIFQFCSKDLCQLILFISIHEIITAYILYGSLSLRILTVMSSKHSFQKMPLSYPLSKMDTAHFMTAARPRSQKIPRSAINDITDISLNFTIHG